MLLQSIYIKYDTNGKTLVKFWVLFVSLSRPAASSISLSRSRRWGFVVIIWAIIQIVQVYRSRFFPDQVEMLLTFRFRWPNKLVSAPFGNK